MWTPQSKTITGWTKETNRPTTGKILLNKQTNKTDMRTAERIATD